MRKDTLKDLSSKPDTVARHPDLKAETTPKLDCLIEPRDDSALPVADKRDPFYPDLSSVLEKIKRVLFRNNLAL